MISIGEKSLFVFKKAQQGWLIETNHLHALVQSLKLTYTPLFLLLRCFFSLFKDIWSSKAALFYFNLALYRSPHKPAPAWNSFELFTTSGLWLSLCSKRLDRQPGLWVTLGWKRASASSREDKWVCCSITEANGKVTGWVLAASPTGGSHIPLVFTCGWMHTVCLLILCMHAGILYMTGESMYGWACWCCAVI